jgi:hypothetical protein
VTSPGALVSFFLTESLCPSRSSGIFVRPSKAAYQVYDIESRSLAYVPDFFWTSPPSAALSLARHLSRQRSSATRACSPWRPCSVLRVSRATASGSSWTPGCSHVTRLRRPQPRSTPS